VAAVAERLTLALSPLVTEELVVAVAELLLVAVHLELVVLGLVLGKHQPVLGLLETLRVAMAETTQVAAVVLETTLAVRAEMAARA
jgi:hypothetical protein